jgi:hypothetical protein
VLREFKLGGVAVAEGSSGSKWLPDIICAFRAAGGTARWPRIYNWIRANRQSLPEDWEETVRATVYHHSSDSPGFKKGDLDVFFKKTRGLWALRYPSETFLGKGDQDLRMQVISNMTVEQFRSYTGKGKEFSAYVMQQVDELKRKFKIE